MTLIWACSLIIVNTLIYCCCRPTWNAEIIFKLSPYINSDIELRTLYLEACWYQRRALCGHLPCTESCWNSWWIFSYRTNVPISDPEDSSLSLRWTVSFISTQFTLSQAVRSVFSFPLLLRLRFCFPIILLYVRRTQFTSSSTYLIILHLFILTVRPPPPPPPSPHPPPLLLLLLLLRTAGLAHCDCSMICLSYVSLYVSVP
jgi:hypothetical protein